MTEFQLCVRKMSLYFPVSTDYPEFYPMVNDVHDANFVKLMFMLQSLNI